MEPTAPDSRQLAEDAAEWRSAYVHIPFCRRRCPYCDFAVVAHDEIAGDPADTIERYVEALLAEIELEPLWGSLDAVNFGGGTPSTLSGDQLMRIVDALRTRFGVTDDAELSIEANPEDIHPTSAAQLAAVGFNRISLGAQSFDAAILGVLGRHHEAHHVIAAVRSLRAAGFESVSLDLIFGAAGEDLTSWTESVAAALALEPDHLSAYSLTVEPGTELWRTVRRGAPEPDPDHQADEYEMVEEAAAAAGLVHYEVSNWARPGHHCRYNLATWAQGEYVAFGLGAHDHRGGRRHRNVRRFDTYLATLEQGRRPVSGSDAQSAFSAEQERLMLGLRRRCGAQAGAVGEALVASDTGERLIAAGILSVADGWLRVERPLLTDTVVRSVLSLSPGDC